VECDAHGQKTSRCIITSQNHGYAVKGDHLPKDWHVWFRNANDDSIEGLRHASGKFFSVQFHPEATPGPEDAGYLFDEFIKILHN
jgi:carbamoyl-phosphate synthase small subunit